MLAYEHARDYIRETLPSGKFHDMALFLAAESLNFIQALFNHMEDKITKLMGMGIDKEPVLILVSGQVIHVFESLFDVRQHAREMNKGPKIDVLVSVVWATLEAHQVMAEYMNLRFKYHPAINAAYVRFLTRQAGANSSAVLATRLNSLEGLVTKIKNDFESHVKNEFKKLDSKVEALIRANDLKRK